MQNVDQQNREEVADSAQRFRMIFEHSRDALFLLEPAKDLILDASPSACALLGYDREELKGMSVAKIHPDEMEDLMRFAQQAAQQGGATTTELSCLTKTGTSIPAEISATFYQDHLGRSLMIAQVRDISERLAAELAKRKLEESLHQAQKMEAVGQLAAGIAHDFNNLLMIINSCSEELLSRNDLVSAKEDLKTILQAGLHGSEMTQQLLAFSRKGETEERILDLVKSIPSAEKMWRRMVGDDVELVVMLYPEECNIFIDPGQFERVLMNLIVNARDAMPKGGRIMLEVERGEVPFASGPWVTVRVSDTGTGIDEATQKQMFEPFFTTKEAGKGTGLGLATVNAIVEQHGGQITVASEMGEGTCFTIFLPLASG